MVVLALIALVLLQRSEGGALGIGGGGGSGGGFLSARGAGNLLTRATAFLAVAFFATSIGLTILARLNTNPSDILERIPDQAGQEEPAITAPAPEGGSTGEGPGVLESLQQSSPSGQSTAPQVPAQGGNQ